MLSDLYRAHWAFIARTVRGMGVPDAVAEDVAQDVFLVARRRLPGFEGRSAARTWLCGIARRVAKDHRRSSARLQRRLAQVPPPAEPPELDDVLARSRATERLEKILEGLDERKRVVYQLAEIEGMTAPEIAQRLGVGCNTIYSRLRLAREAVAAAVDSKASEPKARPPRRAPAFHPVHALAG